MTVQVTPLASGLTIVSHQMRHLESAALGVWVGAGARSEGAEEHGLSHLLEHMAFKGTPSRSAAEIVEEIENVGGEVNASTSVETTAYYARILKQDVGLGLDILGDILRNSSFDPDELEREKHVILQEIGAARDTPDDLVYDLFSEAAYPGQAIGRSILGTPETVSGAVPDMLRDYLERHYRGPRMFVAGAGAIEHDTLVDRAARWFGDLPNGPVPTHAEAKYVGGDAIERRDLMETQILVGFEGVSYAADDFYGAQLLAGILGGGMSSRLFQEVREKRGLCYSIYAFHWSFADSGVFGVHAATSPTDVRQLMPVVLAELERVTHDLSASELDRAKAQLRSGLLMTMENPAARAGQLARQLQLFGRVVPSEELLQRTAMIGVDDIRALAQRVFTGSRPTVAAVGRTDDLPDSAAVAAHFGVRANGGGAWRS